MARYLTVLLAMGIVAPGILLPNIPARATEQWRNTEVSIRGNMFYINGLPTSAPKRCYGPTSGNP